MYFINQLDFLCHEKILTLWPNQFITNKSFDVFDKTELLYLATPNTN